MLIELGYRRSGDGLEIAFLRNAEPNLWPCGLIIREEGTWLEYIIRLRSGGVSVQCMSSGGVGRAAVEWGGEDWVGEVRWGGVGVLVH